MKDFTHLNITAYETVAGLMNRIIEQYCSSTELPLQATAITLYGEVSFDTTLKTMIENSTELLGHLKFFTETYLMAKYGDILVKFKIDNKSGSGISEWASFDFWGTTEIPSELIDKFLDIGFSKTPKIDKDMIPIGYASVTRGGVDIKHKSFRREDFSSVRSNYTAGVQTAFEKLVTTIPAYDNGLIILHGPPGTGKTHLIRSLMTEVSEVSDRDFLICLPPSKFIEDGSLLVEAINSVKNPIVIFEDLGVIFEQNFRSKNIDAFTTFINLSDGLLSHLTNAIFLLTFNETIRSMDKAMTRPGRCLANIEIPLLSLDEGKTFLGDESELLPTQRSGVSLAELYALKRGEPLEPGSEGLIGFEHLRVLNKK